MAMSPRQQARADSTGMDLIRENGLMPDDAGDAFDDGLSDGEAGDDEIADDESGDTEGLVHSEEIGDDTEGDEIGDDFEEPPARQQQRQPKQQQQPAQRDLRQQPVTMDFSKTLTKDAKGNIVDGNGKILAKAGVEARLYTDVHTQARGALSKLYRDARAQLNNSEKKYKRAAEIGLKIHQDFENLQKQYAAIDAYKLAPQELQMAAQFAHKAKTEPLTAIRELLTMATARGIDLSQLGFQPGSFDPKSLLNVVQNEVKTAMTPLQEYMQRQQSQQSEAEQQEQYRRDAEEQVNEFFSNTQEALPFAPMFHRVLQQHPTMPLSQVWDKLQLFLVQKGIDVRNPRQVKQFLSRGQQQQQPQRRPQNWLPNGGGQPRPQGGGGNRRAAPAPVSESYESIVRKLVNNQV
jgi:hypothetical protein